MGKPYTTTPAKELGEFLKKCCVTETLAQLEAEALEKEIIAWMADNPGIDGEIVYQAGQPPRVRAKAITPMTLNRAALPKPPAYAREEHRAQGQQIAEMRVEVDKLLEGIKRGEAPDIRLASKHEIAVKTLFAQLRAMGVRCSTCKFEDCQGNDEEIGLCDLWEPTSPPAE